MVLTSYLIYLVTFLSCAGADQNGGRNCRETNFLRDDFSCRTKYVFAGKVVHVVKPRMNLDIEGPVTTYYFYLTQIWKGPWADTLRVNTTSSSIECGLKFRVGERYIVFAEEKNDTLWTNACFRNDRVEIRNWTRYWLSAPVYNRPGYELSDITLEDLFNVSDNSIVMSTDVALEKSNYIQAHKKEMTDLLSRVVRKDRFPKRDQKSSLLNLSQHTINRSLAIFDWIFTHGCPDIKVDVVYALSDILTPDDYLPLYLRGLFDSSVAVRAAAISNGPMALRSLSPELKSSLVEALVSLLDDPECEIRCRMVMFAGFSELFDVAEPKLRVLIETDECPKVVRAAKKTLAMWESKNVLEDDLRTDD